MKDSPRRTIRVALVAGTAIGALVLSACGSSSTTDSSTSAAAGPTVSASSGPEIDAVKAALVDPSALTMCTSLSYKPFEFTEGDQVVGFDVDLVGLTAGALGVEVKVIDTPFEGIKSGDAMATGKCDLAAAAMSITPEREKAILFSEPYYDAEQTLVVGVDSTATSLADMRGKRIAGQTGTTGLDYLNENKDANGYEIVEYQDFPSQSDALATGQVDGAVQDFPVINQFVNDNSSVVKIVATFATEDQYGIGMKLGNDALKSLVDASIAQAKADGTFDALVTKWIGPSAAATGSSTAPSSN